MGFENSNINKGDITRSETGARVETVDIMPGILDSGTFGDIKGIIPQEYVTSTLAGTLSREFNPVVIGSRPSYASGGIELSPTSREADFLNHGDLKTPIEIVDAIGSVAANYLDNYEALYGPDKLARLKALARGGKIARLSGPQKEEDEEILTDIDGILALVRRFAAGGRSEQAEHFAKISRSLVEKHGRLDYEVQLDGSVKRTIILPQDKRVNEYKREPLEVILPRLSLRNSSAYQTLAKAYRLFGDAAVRMAIRSLPIV
jgi:hypothetical protein